MRMTGHDESTSPANKDWASQISPVNTSNTSSHHDQDMIQSSNCNKAGFLVKRAMSGLDAFANWKERFFVLDGGKISYYKQGQQGLFRPSKDSKDLAHLKGEIELTPDTVVRKSNIDDRVNCFEVATPAKRLYAQAASAGELLEWMAAIEAHVESIRNNARASLHQRITMYTSASTAHLNLNNAPGNVVHFELPMTNDPDVLREMLLEMYHETQRLKDQLASAQNELLLLERSFPLVPSSSNNTSSSNSGSTQKQHRKPSASVINLRHVRQKQFQLWDVAEEGNLAQVQSLLTEALVDVNGKGIDQWSALHLSVCHNHPDVAQVLLARGAYVNARTRERLTPLHLACRHGHLACLELLLSQGADVSLTDQGGNGALHAAAEGGHIDVAQMLLCAGVPSDVPNASGSLPVHLAPIGHPIRVLLRTPVDVSHPDGSKFVGKIMSKPPKDTSLDNSARCHDTITNDDDDDDVTTTNEIEINDTVFRTKYQSQLALGPRDFEFVKILGRGAFAKVYLVRGKGRARDCWYAMKAYNKQNVMQKKQARYIHTEKNALSKCFDHPYIVSLHYAFQSTDRLFLVMDYCGGGDLLSALSRKKRFSEDESAFYIAQIVLAIAHLHSQKILYRDLKPENVVMDLDGNCLLTDLGISKEDVSEGDLARTFCGSPMYLAPEMISRKPHGLALDWYSVGALCYELLTGLPPFYTNNKERLFHNILHGELPLPDYLSSAAKSVLRGFLQRDPGDRLGSHGVDEIKSHAFFHGLDWAKLARKELRPPIQPAKSSKMSKGGSSKVGGGSSHDAQKNDENENMPDVSNFPHAFTDQVISDAERGLAHPYKQNDPRQAYISRKSYYQKEQEMFGDFDFQPNLGVLSEEAQAFEKLAIIDDSD